MAGQLTIECKDCSITKYYKEFPKTYCNRTKSLLGSRRKVCKLCMTIKKRAYMKDYYINKIKKKPKPKINKYATKDSDFKMATNIILN